ncbi:nitroreductase family deazaflavin-dependent oxidoreductase [Mycobacterium sp.]|uniref:nitroreductase family deazaflavin-dependent oxidoreductase n=1 Tax=Mycobacterium sp. TaxID=1785 RepID=UPI0026199C1C|nr:nitroreductase family deazaflavin-dependent oxidoreductase [Mycobacterium sp.]
MSAKDHPNSAPGMPMLFPAWLDRLQMKYMNPVMRRAARYLPTFVVINHQGRKSGKPYRTVVNAYRKGNLVAILLGHGKADWVKNLLAAGEADIQVRNRDVHITNLRVLPTGANGDGLPLVARLGLRRMGVLVADIA